MTKILTVERIVELAQAGRAVYQANRHKPIPAAFIQNWSAALLTSLIKSGMLFEYEKPGEKP